MSTVLTPHTAQTPTTGSADQRRPLPPGDQAVSALAGVSVTRLTPAIGARIDGLDLVADVLEGRPAVRGRALALLRTAVARHHMVALRDQFLTPAEHERVAMLFGPISSSPVQLAIGAERRPSVTTIEDTAERPPAGFPWHTDVSWAPEPPRLGLLNAVEIPETGGDTLWASTATVYERLTPEDRCRADAAELLHAPDASLLESVARHHGTAAAERLRALYPGTVHPLVKVHPVTGRRSVFLSPLYAGPSACTDAELLERLHGALAEPDVQVRWRWRAGDFVIWDETATVHRALTDHYPQRRVMRRCTTAAPR